MAFTVVAIILGLISLATFIIYGIDKYKAVHSLWRIPERVMLLLSFFGGATGGIFGMLLFRHKTSHWYFGVLNILGWVWQIGLLFYLAIAFT